MSNFTCRVDLDTSTTTCPCGSSIVTPTTPFKRYDDWIAEHAAHVTERTITESISADGMRAYGNETPPPPVTVPLAKERAK